MRKGRSWPGVAAKEAKGACPTRRSGGRFGCGELQHPDEFQRSCVTQVAEAADDEVLKRIWAHWSKWVLWVWFSLRESLEVKEKEAEDNLALSTNKVESKGRKAQSW